MHNISLYVEPRNGGPPTGQIPLQLLAEDERREREVDINTKYSNFVFKAQEQEVSIEQKRSQMLSYLSQEVSRISHLANIPINYELLLKSDSTNFNVTV